MGQETGTSLVQEEVGRPAESPESYTPSQPFHPGSTSSGLWFLQSRGFWHRCSPALVQRREPLGVRSPSLLGQEDQRVPRGHDPSPDFSRNKAPRPLCP